MGRSHLAGSLRPPPSFGADPSTPKNGRLYLATQPVNHRFIAGTVWPRLPDSSGAMLQRTTHQCSFHVARHTTLDAQVFRTLLLRHLWLPLSSSNRVCRCVHPFDSSGHHRAACAVGILGSRGFAVESAAARECPEAGGRVSTNQTNSMNSSPTVCPCSTERRWL